MSANEAIPDEFRCNRSDGKQWRCKRRALEGKKLCETHTSQLTLKRDREKAAAAAAAASSTMKLARSSKGDESASSKEGGIIRDSELGESKKRKREAEEADDDEAVRKMQLDLIGLALKREAEKKNKKKIPKKIPKKKEKKKKKGFNGFVGEELTKVLPNGIMSISPPSPTTSDVSSPCDVKVGQEAISITSRRFRSKNIDRFPFRKMQAVPFKGKLVNAKKRCHWCGTRGSEDLISCLSCERNFFCVDCIEKRNKGSKEEVEKKCPVCCGSCRCKSCLATLSGVTE